MIKFRNWVNGPSRNAEDVKILLIGMICSIFIFTIVSIYEEFQMNSAKVVTSNHQQQTQEKKT